MKLPAQNKRKKSKDKHASLKQYQRNVLRIDPDRTIDDEIGKLCENCNDVSTDPGQGLDSPMTEYLDHETRMPVLPDEFKSLLEAEDIVSADCEKYGLPTVAELHKGKFGRPSKNHSFTQEAAFETVLFHVLKTGSQYMSPIDKVKLCSLHPLIGHLAKMIDEYSKIDFSQLRKIDLDYRSQKQISRTKVKMFMACLFHFNLSVANVYRYVGNNYTASYRDVTKAIERMRGLVDENLLDHYSRVMTIGAPAHFNYESTRDNAMLHWREGNHPSIALNPEKLQKSMYKLDQNQFVIPFNSWIARYVPHLFFTPQHLLDTGRQIFDASRRFTPTSVPVNRMTSTHLGVELDCDYGTVLQRVLIRVWNLRITYPKNDIILHANDVKSCFRQIKHHPDVMGAFSYIIADTLYMSCGLTFGSDFSPQSWEVCRRIAEQLATSLFDDETLVEKHRIHLDKLQWSKKLGKGSTNVTAHATASHKGVLDQNGIPVNTPHHMFVDDDIYAEVYDVERIERSCAAGIESLMIILGESDLAKRQDPISWEKLFEMIIHWKNKILGNHIDTRKMTIQAPQEYIDKVVKLMDDKWNQHRRAFEVKEAEMLAGQLTHIANTTLWLKHLLAHVYTSITAGLSTNKSILVCTSKSFRDQLKIAKNVPLDDIGKMEQSFAISETAKKVHNFRKPHVIVKTLKEELKLIREALSSKDIIKSTPIAHFMPGEEDGESHGDSSLDSAGGWSTDMCFWWWHGWPEKIRLRTLRFIKDGKSGELIDINALEYATVIINYAACYYYWVVERNCQAKNIPYPRVLIKDDNAPSEFWAKKGCKRSMIGRRLGRIQCAMMMNNPVGMTTDHVDTHTNVIADKISRWKLKSDVSPGFAKLLQEYPQLKNCRRFHPSNELLSLISDALSSERHVKPLEIMEVLRNYPGRIAS